MKLIVIYRYGRPLAQENYSQQKAVLCQANLKALQMPQEILAVAAKSKTKVLTPNKEVFRLPKTRLLMGFHEKTRPKTNLFDGFWCHRCENQPKISPEELEASFFVAANRAAVTPERNTESGQKHRGG